jgi:hypothetical protein
MAELEKASSSELDASLAAKFIEPASEITVDSLINDSETDTIMFQDREAVMLVIKDAERADQWLNINQWPSGWTLADTIYQSPAANSAFDGGQVAQANVPKFTVSNHISSIVPKIMGGIFYEKPPFELRPRPGTDKVTVDAKRSLFTTQLDLMHFEEETERAVEQQALLGTCIMKWGYTEYKRKQKRYVRKGEQQQYIPATGQIEMVDTPESDSFEVVIDNVVESHPWIKYCDIRTVLVDPGTRVGDIRKAKWVVYRDYATYDDLDHLRGIEGYKIPSEAELKNLFLSKPTSGPDNITLTIPEGMYGYLQHALPRSYKTSANPLDTPLEILERWDKDRVIVILSFSGRNLLIRNEVNPYGKIPFLSANWRNIPDCFYGQGLGILLGPDQLVEQGVTNLSLDLLAFCLQPPAVRKKGFNTLQQNQRWSLGGIIDVDEDVDKAFRFLEMPRPPSEAFAAIAQSQASAAASSGANEQVVQGIGSPGARTTGMRSGTGAAAVIQANASRLDSPMGRFIRQVFEPWLQIMDELNNDLLPTSVLKRVLGEELGPKFKIDHIQFREAELEFEVLAGAHLGAKKEMAQFLPIMVQLMTAPAFNTGIQQSFMKWDVVAIFKAFAESAGWKYSQNFLIKMTDEEKQQAKQNQPAALQQRQAQAQQAQSQQKFQQDQQKEAQEQLGKAQNEVMRGAVEHALQSEVTGEPANTGFGSTTEL